MFLDRLSHFPIEAQPGQILLKENKPALMLVRIDSGFVRIHAPSSKVAAMRGAFIFKGPGTFVGQETFAQLVYSRSVFAQTKVTATGWKKEEVNLETGGLLFAFRAIQLIASIEAKERQMLEAISSACRVRTEEALSFLLPFIAKWTGGGNVIEGISQELIGALIGCKREHITVIFSVMEKKGLLKVGRKRLELFGQLQKSA